MNAGSVNNLTMEAASPNPTMPPIIADPTNSGCLDDPNFATICSFIEKFGEVCRIDALPFAELQEMIENTNEVSLPLVQLHVRLLRRVFKSIAVDKWERSLAKFGHTYCNQDGWEIERFGYKKAKIQTKLRLLKNLLEAQFDFNVKFKSEVNKIPASDLRLVPLGRDTEGQLYWYQVDPDANLRVYREDVDDETWEVVATSKEEMMELINQLQRGEVKKPLIPDDEVIVEEDSNGKDIETKEILLDTGKVQDEDDESENEIDDDGEPDWKETDDSVDEEAMEIDEEYVAPEEVVVNPTVDGDSKVDVFVNASNNLTLNPSDRASENTDKVNISSSEWSIKGSDPKAMSAMHSEFVANSYMRSQKVEPLTLRKEMFREEKINTSSYPYIAVKSKVKYEEPLPSFETNTDKCLDAGYKIEDNKSGNNDVVADKESVKAKLDNQTIGTLDYTTKQSEEKKVKNEQEFLKNQLPIDLKAPTTQMEAKSISSTKASIQVLGSKSKAHEAKPPPFTLHASSIQKGGNDKPPSPEKFSTRQLDSKSEDSKRKQQPITLDISINEISNKTPSSEKVSTPSLVAEPGKYEAKRSPITGDISSTQGGNKPPSPVKVTKHNIVSKAEFTETRQPHFTLNTSRKEDALPLPEKVTTQGFGPEPKYSERPSSLHASHMQMENKEPENLSVRTRTQVPDNKHKEAKQSRAPIIASDIPIIQAKEKSFSDENVKAKDVGLKPEYNETQPRIEKMKKPVDKIDNKVIDVKPEHVPDTIEKHSDITQCKDKILVQDEMTLSHDTPQFPGASNVNQASTTVSDSRQLDIDAVQESKGEELLRGKKLNKLPKIIESNNPPKIVESNNPPKTEEIKNPTITKQSVQPLKIEESIHPPQIEQSIQPPQIEESIHPPQIEESIRPPKIKEFSNLRIMEESIHPPKLKESVRPPKLEESVRPPKLEESVRPPKLEESVRPPKLEESVRPPKLEESVHPPKLEESVHPPKLAVSVHPPKLEESIHPLNIEESIHPTKIKESGNSPKMTEFNNAPKMEESSKPPKIEESSIPPKMEKSIKPPKMEESSKPPKIEESSVPPKMEESSKPPKKEESSKPPKKEESSKPPKIEESSIPPKMEESSKPPKKEESSKSPKIEESCKPPKMEESIKPPKIAEFSNPTKITEFSNSPKIPELSNTPTVEEINKFPQNVEPSKSLITEESNKSFEEKQFDEVTQKEELVQPKQDDISSKHEELNLPLKLENIPQTNEALNIPLKCEELSIPLRKEKETEFHKSESVNEFYKKDESIIPPANVEESNGLLKQKEGIDSEQVSINECNKPNVNSLDNPPKTKSEESVQISQPLEFKESTLKSSFETPESTVEISQTYDTKKVLEITAPIEQSLKSTPLITETTESPNVSESDTREAISVDQNTSIHEIKSHVEINVPTQSVPPEVSTSKPDLSAELGGEVSSKQNSQMISEPRPSLDLDEIDSDDGMEISDLVIDTNDEPLSVEETKEVPSVDIRATEENSTSISESQLSPQKPVQIDDAPVNVINDNTVISKSKEVNNKPKEVNSKPEETKFVDESQTTAKNCSSDTTSETSVNVTAVKETENDSEVKFSDNVNLNLQGPTNNVKEILLNADITSAVKLAENKDGSSGRLDVSTSKPLESLVHAAVDITDAPQINPQVQKENSVNNPPSEEASTVAIVEKSPVELMEHKQEIAVNIPGDLKAQSPSQVRPSVESNETFNVPLEREKGKLSNESFPTETTCVQEAAVSNEESTDTATNKIDTDLATTDHAKPSELVITKAENDTIPETQKIENAPESSLELKSAESSNEKAAGELSTVMQSVSSDIEAIQQPLISTDLPKNESTNNTASDSKSKEEEISKAAVSGLVGYEYSSSEDEDEMPTQTSATREPIPSGALKRKADDVLESASKVPKIVESVPPPTVFNPIVGETIEEDLMTIQGQGTGAENEGGNEEPNQSATEEAGEIEEEEIEIKPKGRGRPRKKAGAPRGRPGRPVGSGRGGVRANAGTTPPRVRKRELENLSISFEGAQEVNGGDSMNDRPVRASRRIASIRQKEEEERRKLEEEKLAQLKAAQIRKQQKQVDREKKKAEKGDVSDSTPKTKKNKKENKEYLPSPSESDTEEEDAEDGEEYEQKPTKLKKKRKRNKNGKAKKGGNPWVTSSSEDDEAVEEEEEYHYEEEEEELVFNKSDHEFSPESDLGEESDACPSRHARTAKRGEETVDKYEETNCDKCGKGDHPEWILLCDKCDKGWHASCVRPQLWVIPEGQWFCPPCQHNTLIEKLNENLIEYEKILKRRENEVLRKQRLAYVGISLDNVLPGAAPILEREDEHIIEKSDQQCRQERYVQREKKNRRRRINSDEEDDELIGDDFINDNDSNNSDYNSSDDQSDGPIYKLRARRATKSFNFKEYDDMINSALRVDDDMEIDGIEAPELEKKPETSNGKGKSMSGEDEESEEEESDPGGKVNENGEVSKVRKRLLMSAKRTSSDEPAGKKMMEDTDEEELDEKEKNRQKELMKLSQRKTKRRLNDLDAPSDEDEDDSDEDFKGSGGDDDEEDDEEAVEDDSEWSGDRDADESDDSIQRGARNKKQGRLGRREKYVDVGTVRRSTRRRRARISYDESDQDEEEEGTDKWNSDETEESESNSESEDETWGKKKKKASNPPKSRFFQGPIVQSKPKTVKKKRRKTDDDEVDRAWSNNSKKKAAEEPVERRTRGRKINFKDILDSGESDDDGNIRPKRRRILSDSDDDSDAPTSSRKLIEEIKAQNAREAALYAASKSQNEKKAKAEPKEKPIVLPKEEKEKEPLGEESEKHLLAEEQATAAVSALFVPKTKPIKSPETVQRVTKVPPSLPSDSSSSSKGRSRSRSPNEKSSQLELEMALAKPVPAPPFPPALAKALGRKSATSAANIAAFSMSMDNNINLLPPLGQPLPPQPPVSLSSSPTHPHLSHSPSNSPSSLSLSLPLTAPASQTPPPAKGSKKNNNSINVPTPPKGSLSLPPAALTPPMPSMSPQQQQALPQGIRANLPSDIARLANPGLYSSNPSIRPPFHPAWRSSVPPQYGNPGAGIPSTSIGKPPPLNSAPFMTQQGSPRSGYPSPPPLRIPNPGNSPMQAFQHFKRDALLPGMPMYRMSPPPQQGGGPLPGILPPNMAALNQGHPDRYFGGPVPGGSPYGHPAYGLPPPHNQSPPQSIFPPFDYRIQHLQRPSEPFKEESPPQSQPPARTTSSPPPPPTSTANTVTAAKEDPPPPQGDGEFGGLVSYFSSQRSNEEDLDT